MRKIGKICIIFILVLIIATINFGSFAFSGALTSEMIEKELLNINKNGGVSASTISNDKISFDKIKVTADTIEFTRDGYTLVSNYKITDKLEITSNIIVKKGMKYKEYHTLDEMSEVLGLYVYSAIAKLDGCNYDASFDYYVECLFASLFSGDSLQYSMNNSMLLFDDEDPVNEGVTVIGDNYFYASQFPEKGIDYVKSTHSRATSMDDSFKNNTFKYSTSEAKVENDVCTVSKVFTIDYKKDFSVIQKAADLENDKEKNKREEEFNKAKSKVNKQVTLSVGQDVVFSNIIGIDYSNSGLVSEKNSFGGDGRYRFKAEKAGKYVIKVFINNVNTVTYGIVNDDGEEELETESDNENKILIPIEIIENSNVSSLAAVEVNCKDYVTDENLELRNKFYDKIREKMSGKNNNEKTDSNQTSSSTTNSTSSSTTTSQSAITTNAAAPSTTNSDPNVITTEDGITTLKIGADESTENKDKKENNEVSNTSNKPLPKTGASKTVLGVIGVLVGGIIFFKKKNEEYKDIK